MSLVEQQGRRELVTSEGRLRLLSAAPLIAPARCFTFPMHVPGEEEALQRGSIYVEVTPAQGGSFLAQCAIGFSGSGVAHGLWPSPVAGTAMVAAGGYAYLLSLENPQDTVLLPLRPVTGIVFDHPGQRAVLLGYHHMLVLEADAQFWQSERISWEGIAVHAVENSTVHGTGWDMPTDADVPFTLDLETRTLTGGGYSGSRG